MYCQQQCPVTYLLLYPLLTLLAATAVVPDAFVLLSIDALVSTAQLVEAALTAVTDKDVVAAAAGLW